MRLLKMVKMRACNFYKKTGIGLLIQSRTGRIYTSVDFYPYDTDIINLSESALREIYSFLEEPLIFGALCKTRDIVLMDGYISIYIKKEYGKILADVLYEIICKDMPELANKTTAELDEICIKEMRKYDEGKEIPPKRYGGSSMTFAVLKWFNFDHKKRPNHL